MKEPAEMILMALMLQVRFLAILEGRDPDAACLEELRRIEDSLWPCPEIDDEKP